MCLCVHLAPDDYTTVSRRLTFTPTETEQEITIPITDDNTYEPSPEDFTAQLTLVTDSTDVLIDPAVATVNINDDDSEKCHY